MHTVIETSVFRRAVEAAGITEDELLEITTAIAENPSRGDVIKGAGGARKLRWAGRGKGKSGGYRVITFYAADDVPVFLLDLYSKGDRVNLSKAERNELAKRLGVVADEYRASTKKKVANIGRT